MRFLKYFVSKQTVLDLRAVPQKNVGVILPEFMAFGQLGQQHFGVIIEQFSVIIR